VTHAPIGRPNTTAASRVVLDLACHCIQTAARQRHAELVAHLVGGAADPAAEAEVALLAEFLAGSDFPRLRADHPALAGGAPCRVVIGRAPGGAPRWRILDPAPAGGER
jgi:hypothetical protein